MRLQDKSLFNQAMARLMPKLWQLWRNITAWVYNSARDGRTDYRVTRNAAC